PPRYPSGRRGAAPILDADPLRTRPLITADVGALTAYAQQYLPLGRIVRFAVATAMRQAEISRIEWSDVDMSKRTVTIRDRKDPRRKDGNDQVVPLLNSTGYDAWQIMLEQRILTRGLGRVFSLPLEVRRSCLPQVMQRHQFWNVFVPDTLAEVNLEAKAARSFVQVDYTDSLREQPRPPQTVKAVLLSDACAASFLQPILA
ncbi:tyrosine-type recombinase/integrase, partial [Bradyrhizobium sp. LeoA1S1]